MNNEKRRPAIGLILLFVFLAIAIVTLSTVLVGRALGWWEYADLPVIGSLFPAEPADPDGEDIDKTENDLEQQLELLKMENKQRQQQVHDLQASARQQEERINELLAEIAAFESRLQADKQEKTDANLLKTAKIYENMRAQEAAQVLERLPTDEVRSILYLMPPDAAGAILGNMAPEKAAKIASTQVGR